jgi:hypothetical protein
MLQRSRAWVSLTLGSETHSNKRGEAVSTFPFHLAVDMVHRHAGSDGPVSKEEGLRMK